MNLFGGPTLNHKSQDYEPIVLLWLSSHQPLIHFIIKSDFNKKTNGAYLDYGCPLFFKVNYLFFRLSKLYPFYKKLGTLGTKLTHFHYFEITDVYYLVIIDISPKKKNSNK